MKTLLFAALGIVLAALLHPAAAMAADTTTVAVPIGDWLQQAVPIVAGLSATWVMWLLSRLPAQWLALAKTARFDQLLVNAIGYGLNAVAGAEKGKVLSVDLGNKVVAAALQYAIDNGSEAVIKWAGGRDVVAQKIIARLPLDSDAAVVPSAGGMIVKAVPNPAPMAPPLASAA